MIAQANTEVKDKISNPMREIFIEKMLLSCGAKSDGLEKSKKLLKLLSGMEPQVIKTQKRIPDFDVSPGLEVGTRVTIRGEEKITKLLQRLLGALDNIISEDQIENNHFSFGIKEYIEIPGVEYQRDIGIRGLNITIVFNRAGARVARKKIKAGKVPKKQHVTKEEIINYMEENFNTKID